ncbi:MAG: AI-2E family transporter, partial [Acidobacteria bacterium]
MNEPRPAGPAEAPPPSRRRGLLARLRPQHVPRAGRHAVRRWQDYRERQLTLLAESNRLQGELHDHVGHPAGGGRDDAAAAPPGGGAADAADGAGAAGAAVRDDQRGARPTSLASPFYVGFTFALGALVAWLLVENLTRLTSVLT